VTISKSSLRLVLLPLLAALLVIGFQVARKPLRIPHADEFYYLTIARDLALHGVFTDGTFKTGPFQRTEGPAQFGDEDARWARPGRFFAPAYPFLVYLVGLADPQVARSVACAVREGGPAADGTTACPTRYATLVGLQVMLWGIAMLAVFQMAWLLSRSQVVAWLALVIALATGEPGYYARTYLSESVSVVAFLVFMLFAMRGLEHRHLSDCILAGVSLGLAALGRPAFVYLFYLLCILLPLAAAFLRGKAGVPGFGHVATFAAATMVVLAPWMIRNQLRFGDPGLSSGYAEVILMQRLSYNQMSWTEWAVSFVYWLPDFGDNLAKALFPRPYWHRLGFSDPHSYYLDSAGAGSFRARILAANPQDGTVLAALMKQYLVGDLVKHVMVTIPLTLRGLYVGKYLALAGLALLWPAFAAARRQGRAALFLAMALPPLLMAGLHGFVSVNIVRYNLPVIAVYAFVVASSTMYVAKRHALGRSRKEQPRQAVTARPPASDGRGSS
jgi:hypothetical protein